MTSFDINVEDFQSAVDFLSVQENVDSDKIGIIGICGWGGMALQTACIDTRIKATVVSTMYDMSRVAGNGYYDEQDNEEARYNKRVALNNQRIEDAKNRKYAYKNMIKDSKYAENKELVIIPEATHTDLYDQKDKIPFDKIEEFIRKNI